MSFDPQLNDIFSWTLRLEMHTSKGLVESEWMKRNRAGIAETPPSISFPHKMGQPVSFIAQRSNSVPRTLPCLFKYLR